MKVWLRWALCLYIVFLGSEEYFTELGLVYKLAVALFVLFVLALVLGEIKIRFSWTSVLMTSYATFALLSTLWSVDVPRSLTYAFVLVQLLVTTWIANACIESESDRNLVVWCLVLASVFPSVSMVHDHLTGRTAWTLSLLAGPQAGYGDRMTFGDADPNLFAYRIVVSVAAAMFLAQNSPAKWARLLLFSLAGLFAATSLLTGSRGGGVALIITLMVLILGDAKQKKGRALLVMVGLGVLLTFSLRLLPSTLSDRYLGISREVASGSMAGRKDIYRESLGSFKRHPLLGVGYLAFESASRQRGGEGSAAHSDPLQNLVDLGLAGLGIYLLLVATMFRESVTIPPPWNRLALGLLTAYGVSSLGITLLSAKLPWVAFGIMLGMAGQRKPAFCPWLPVLGRNPAGDPDRHG